MLPLSKLIYDRIGNNKTKRNDLIHRLGFSNLTKGNNTLVNLLLGRYTEAVIERLRTALDVDDSAFLEALNLNNQILEIGTQSRQLEMDKIGDPFFTPYIKVDFERFRPQYSRHAIELIKYGRIELEKEILVLPEIDQLHIVRNMIVNKYSKYYEDKYLYQALGGIVAIKYFSDHRSVFNRNIYESIDIKNIPEIHKPVL